MTLIDTNMQVVDGDMFFPDEEASAQHFAQEHGLTFYTLTLNGNMALEKDPEPEAEILGFIPLLDRGPVVELNQA